MFQVKSKVRIILFIIALIAVFLFFSYQMPYYIHKPGHADPLNPVVEVKGGFESEGDMHLVTIQGGKATPFQYILALVKDYYDILPVEEVLQEGMTDSEYRQLQLMMMESSQESSKVVAYKAANKEIEIEYNGVYVVSVVKDMPAEGILQPEDEITKIDGKTIKEANDLIDYVSGKQVGDKILVTIQRQEETFEKEITLKALEQLDGKPGIGISLVTNRDVNVSPELQFSSGEIGGPSAGLMFSLEIYDQLTEEDLTKGLQIAGTGEIDYEGNVGRIGGIDKKVVAADRAGCAIFFAPNENGREGSNYELAKKVAEEINTEMKIVPVDHFEDAVAYLESL
ncbi:Lon-like protease with PDZ domain [Gracilibacillus boraciitolerans JCM 21714]|uniref:endopeptidase La n=1 Tax=Gracilibacillus boraciitolerans JCM 21714 TaxID=1298598 RepID=W4VEC1_9BACI|nr:SepM family pheromone-processing serine protease [Gracilibacillus boraciitolerans]GAE91755.1 Lon-like protease with PDZ domain [Gracilibacillus boraciitolerans JCM 21714]